VWQRELYQAFARGRVIESVGPSRYEARPDFKDVAFSEGGPKAWSVVVRRVEGEQCQISPALRQCRSGP
jgi:hypothetical protein